jgi:hypothetical protein
MEMDIIVKVHQTQKNQHLMVNVLLKIVKIKEKELERTEIYQEAAKKMEIIKKVVLIVLKTNLDKKI